VDRQFAAGPSDFNPNADLPWLRVLINAKRT
jgi:hypothetical protein